MSEKKQVTQREIELPDGVTMLSTTNVEGEITYVNEAFVVHSGYQREELLGRPQNLLRHPDMPAELFADMWGTIRGGEAWSGVIKTRSKSGDHYWVRTNVTPIYRRGQLSGYMWVRIKTERHLVEAAERAYQAMVSGRGHGLLIYKGRIQRRGWLLGLPDRVRNLTVHSRIRLASLGGWLGLQSAFWLAGLPGPTWLGLALTSLLLAVLVDAWLEHQIAHPLQAVLRQALKVAAGYPESEANIGRIDDVGMILRAINQAGHNVRSLVDDVGLQLLGLRQATAQVLESSTELSQRTEEQAANVEQTAASMEQLQATVRKNSEGAQASAQLANGAHDVASQGGAAVGQVVTTMEQISASSQKIGDIVGVIDGIAFQTNILALNAAVEAARAGEQGRGFAVVATEVRALAQRSAGAAREIRQLIGASVSSMTAGADLAKGARTTMDDIVRQVHSVAQLVAEIGSASVEQSRGISQIAEAVAQLDRVTQQNASMVQQSASIADSLQHRTDRLGAAVAIFA